MSTSPTSVPQQRRIVPPEACPIQPIAAQADERALEQQDTNVPDKKKLHQPNKWGKTKAARQSTASPPKDARPFTQQLRNDDQSLGLAKGTFYQQQEPDWDENYGHSH